jgi:hypothetical protein
MLEIESMHNNTVKALLRRFFMKVRISSRNTTKGKTILMRNGGVIIILTDNEMYLLTKEGILGKM